MRGSVSVFITKGTNSQLGENRSGLVRPNVQAFERRIESTAEE